ncbi:MAG: sporulation integral membrane protein YtvI [Oscillospiraceae bacterium]|jgi:sporulation integral membrane protein YtvI|nr:sporulation integral membrane protein YtvI [Oscillospiraceae bacterium]
MPEKKSIKLLWKLLYAALAVLGGWAFLRWGLGWVLPFLIALLMAYLMERPVRFLGEKLRLPRWAASALCTLAVFGALSAVAYLLAARLITEIGGLLKQLPEWMAGLPDIADKLTLRVQALIVAAPVGMQDFLNNSLGKILDEGITVPQSVYTTLGGWVTGVAGALPNLFLFVMTCVLSTYFLSSDFPHVSAFLLRQLPAAWRERAARAKGHLSATLGKWLKAQGILILLTFLQLCAGMWLLGIEYPLTVAGTVALVDALPVLGLGAVLVPWAGIALLTGNTGRALGLIILFAVCSLTRSFAEPKLVGHQIGLPPVVAMLAMYVGFQTFGVLGMILFPFLAILLKQMQDWGYIKLWKTEDKQTPNP